MTGIRSLCLLTACAALPLSAGEPGLPAGLYRVEWRLELPHLERYGVTNRGEVCIPEALAAGALPVPVLSHATPFATCTATPDPDGSIAWNIRCEGRDAARARASYRLTATGFRGGIAIISGAKNMTMTEWQVGERLGMCATVIAKAP